MPTEEEMTELVKRYNSRDEDSGKIAKRLAAGAAELNRQLNGPITDFDRVRAFHEKFDLPVRQVPQTLYRGVHTEEELTVVALMKQAETYIRNKRYPDDVQWGRIQMMLEELREYAEAVISGDLVSQADSLVDLDYFVHGTELMHGFPHEEIMTEVHRANMSKVRVESASESQRLNKLDVKKPEGWVAPNVQKILDDARAERMHR